MIKGSVFKGTTWEDPDQYQSPWSGIVPIEELTEVETTCGIGHVYNKYLDDCPMCGEGYGTLDSIALQAGR